MQNWTDTIVKFLTLTDRQPEGNFMSGKQTSTYPNEFKSMLFLSQPDCTGMFACALIHFQSNIFAEYSAVLIHSTKLASVFSYWLTSCSLNLKRRWGAAHCQTRLSRYPAKSHWPRPPPCPPVLPVDSNIHVKVPEYATIIIRPLLVILCWHQILNHSTQNSNHNLKINTSGEQKQ